MSIQPSVIIWTVLCFCALLLILKKLLFAPILRCMDERENRIRSMEDRRRAYEEARIAAEGQAETDQARQQLDAAAGAEKLLQEAQATARLALTQKQQTEDEATARYRDSMSSERAAYLKEAAGEAKQLSELFVSQLIS